MAQTEQHTPGPWEVFDHYCGRDPETAGEEYSRTRLIGLGQFDTIAEVRQGSDDVPGDVDANARLIAAAPELLEALKALRLQALQSDLNDPANEWGWEALQLANAAIAKATGASS